MVKLNLHNLSSNSPTIFSTVYCNTYANTVL